MEKSGRWYGVYRKDVLQSDGTFKREQCWQPLGLVSEQSERAAWKQFQPFLDRVNDAAKKLPPRSGLTLNQFVEEWRTNVAVNLKGSTTRAAESHLRAHIIPKLGSLHLPEITTKTVQGFVAYLASGGRSRKTVENVLLTLSSILRTAKAWDYACGDFRFADLTLPREGVRKEPRCFTDDEVRKIIAKHRNHWAPSLRLRRCSVCASERLLHFVPVTWTLRSTSSAFGRALTLPRERSAVKSKASSADLPMSKELEVRLRTHLQAHDRQERPALRQPAWPSILSEQATGKALASALGCAGHPSRRVPFDASRRGQFSARRRRNSGCCAAATASF